MWDLITPREAIAVREAGAAASLRRLLGGREAEAAKAARLLWRAAQDLDFAGRVLSAANAELPVSGGPLTRQAGGVPEDSIRRVWTAIALHTTPGIPEFMEPEVALVTAGVEYDVLGIGYRDISDADRAYLAAQEPGP